MQTLEDIKNTFGEKVYETIYFDLRALSSKYDFLCFSYEKWVALTCKNASKAKKDNVDLNYVSSVISNYIEKDILKYIKNEYKERKVRIFNNLLIKLLKEKSNYRQLIKRFIEILENKFGLPFDAVFYDFLKNKSKAFKDILSRMEMLDFSFEMFKEAFLDKYEIYIKFIGKGHSFGWIVSKVNKLLKLKIISLSNDYLGISRLVILNYEILYSMYEGFNNIIKEISFHKFLSLIVRTQDFLKIEEFIKEYKENFMYKGAYDSTFFVRLNNLFKKSSAKDTQFTRKSDNVVKKSEKNKIKKSIYDCFPDYEGVSAEEKIRKIDELLQTLAEKDRIIIQDASDENEVNYIINGLRIKYIKYIENGKKSTIKNGNIEGYFPDIEGITPKKKREMIEEVLGLLSDEHRLNVIAYVNGDKDNITNSLRALQDLKYSESRYSRYAKSGKLPKPRKSRNKVNYLEYIQDEFYKTSAKQKSEIVSALVSVLNEEERKKLNYFNQSLVTFESIESILIKLNKQYNEYLDNRTVSLNLANNNHQMFYSLILFLGIDYETKFDYKLDSFIVALKTLEFNFRKLGFTKEEYQNWILDVSLKIESNLELEVFLGEVINLAYYEIKNFAENDKRGR